MRLHLVLLLSALVLGCAANQPKPAFTVERVLELTRQGTPTSEILAQMRDAGTVYRLSASQLAKLREQGVADEVIDYMQDTYLYEVERRSRRYGCYDDPYWCGPYVGWGVYPYWGWGAAYPYYWGPPYRPPHRHPHKPPSGGHDGSADRKPPFLGGAPAGGGDSPAPGPSPAPSGGAPFLGGYRR